MRTKWLCCFAVTLTVVAVSGLVVGAADDEKPKYTIKEVMKKAHKDGLMKKLSEGGGTKADAEELLDLYKALGKNKPPKGEPGSWEAKTKVLVDAAQKVVDDKPGAREELKKAANCAECHKAHKP
jgi:cytochrome c553